MSDCSTCGGCEKKSSLVSVESETVIQVLVKAIEHKLKVNQGHGERVAGLSRWFSNYLGIDTEMTELIGLAGYLHDIGMLGVSENVVMKEDSLSEAEWEEIYAHPMNGFEYLEGYEDLAEVQVIVRDHHEHYDGGGYPNGLKGQESHLGARIIALCEAVDTMAMNQSYRKALSFEEIEAEVRNNAGKHFDPWLANHIGELLEIGKEMYYNKY